MDKFIHGVVHLEENEEAKKYEVQASNLNQLWFHFSKNITWGLQQSLVGKIIRLLLCKREMGEAPKLEEKAMLEPADVNSSIAGETSNLCNVDTDQAAWIM